MTTPRTGPGPSPIPSTFRITNVHIDPRAPGADSVYNVDANPSTLDGLVPEAGSEMDRITSKASWQLLSQPERTTFEKQYVHRFIQIIDHRYEPTHEARPASKLNPDEPCARQLPASLQVFSPHLPSEPRGSELVFLHVQALRAHASALQADASKPGLGDFFLP